MEACKVFKYNMRRSPMDLAMEEPHLDFRRARMAVDARPGLHRGDTGEVMSTPSSRSLWRATSDGAGFHRRGWGSLWSSGSILEALQVIVESPSGHEFVVASFLNDLALVHHEDSVGPSDG